MEHLLLGFILDPTGHRNAEEKSAEFIIIPSILKSVKMSRNVKEPKVGIVHAHFFGAQIPKYLGAQVGALFSNFG